MQEGRAATGGRAELFAPGSIDWPASGIEIRDGHHTPALARAVPSREANGEIRIETRATPEIFTAVEQRGRRYMSVEFHALAVLRTRGDVREIASALVVGAALTDDSEYPATTAEVRARRRRRFIL